MLSGRLFEDFVPISDTQALITTGRRLRLLDRIELVSYVVEDRRVMLVDVHETLAEGEDMRLGGMFDGQLVYSHKGGVVGADVESKTAHQPFVREGLVYYTDDWPGVSIYRDGELFLGHFLGMKQVGNPCWGGDYMYFEARNTMDARDAWKWAIYFLRDGNPVFFAPGANPAYWNGRLFWGLYNGRGFDYCCSKVDRFEGLSADPPV